MEIVWMGILLYIGFLAAPIVIAAGMYVIAIVLGTIGWSFGVGDGR